MYNDKYNNPKNNLENNLHLKDGAHTDEEQLKACKSTIRHFLSSYMPSTQRHLEEQCVYRWSGTSCGISYILQYVPILVCLLAILHCFSNPWRQKICCNYFYSKSCINPKTPDELPISWFCRNLGVPGWWDCKSYLFDVHPLGSERWTAPNYCYVISLPLGARKTFNSSSTDDQSWFRGFKRFWRLLLYPF